ncbi:DUF3667 domain-containing protein [Kordiimonas laminariae]|uniref:DUF3667 domain-containing protein n=1 Tax=Kordiimonas laminariae TaxID=2917717 RepID=UPI001FF1D07A|nr:DUF3667 domain-containing protein [Kordiimonas laminariae]MCK0068409.1 DUF3667 domain-containing protein [Kordiimonas laminariae]
MTVFSPHEGTCVNCENTITGLYCNQCGQKANTQRLEIKTLLGGAFKALMELDSKVFRTIKELTLNPGQVALNYIGGARVAYLNPVKYCITIFALILAIMHLSGQIDQTVEKVTTANLAWQEQSKDLNDAVLKYAKARQKATVEVYSEYLQPMQLILIPIAALFLRLLHYRKRRNYAEIASFLCYIFAHTALINIPILLAMLLFGMLSYFNLWVYSAVLLFMFAYGSKIFFKLTWPGLLISLLLSTAVYFALAGLTISVAAELRMAGYI